METDFLLAGLLAGDAAHLRGNVSSGDDAPLLCEPDGINGAFCAKAAMHSWAKGLSREVGKHGITVNSIPPGRIISEQILRNYTPEYRQWQSEHEIPVGEYGQPEDIANLACFLASPRGRYITGAVIPVDGGLRRYQF